MFAPIDKTRTFVSPLGTCPPMVARVRCAYNDALTPQGHHRHQGSGILSPCKLHASHELGDLSHITDLLQGTYGVDEGGRLLGTDHCGCAAPKLGAHFLPSKGILR